MDLDAMTSSTYSLNYLYYPSSIAGIGIDDNNDTWVIFSNGCMSRGSTQYPMSDWFECLGVSG